MGHSNAGELSPQSFITFSSRQYAKALIQISRKNSFSKNDIYTLLSLFLVPFRNIFQNTECGT